MTLSQARKLFVAAVLKLDDYSELKREFYINYKCLKKELRDINDKLRNIDKQRQQGDRPIVNILNGFSSMDTTDKKVSDKRAIVMLAKNGIQVNEEEANVILHFLYLAAKNYNKPEKAQEAEPLMRNRTFEKRPL